MYRVANDEADMRLDEETHSYPAQLGTSELHAMGDAHDLQTQLSKVLEPTHYNISYSSVGISPLTAPLILQNRKSKFSIPPLLTKLVKDAKPSLTEFFRKTLPSLPQAKEVLQSDWLKHALKNPQIAMAAIPALLAIGTASSQPVTNVDEQIESTESTGQHSILSITIPEVAIPASCAYSMPVIFNGENQAFSIRYETQCDWLKSMMPKAGETLKFGEYATITGTGNGDVIHTLNGSKMRVPTQNWRAAIEGLMATGAMDKPRIFAVDYINMLRQESGIGTNTHGSGTSSCGAAQVTSDTFGGWIRKYGKDHNYGRLANKFTKLGQETVKRNGKLVTQFSDKHLVQQQEYKKDFKEHCDELSFSFTFGARNYLDANTEWQNKVDAGKLRLPFGLTKVNNRIAYFTHFGGDGGGRSLANRMAENPDRPMDKLVSSEVFNSNHDVFFQRTPEKDLFGNYKRDDKGRLVMGEKHIITGREFYEWIGWKIGLSETPHPAKKDPRGFVASNGVHVEPKVAGKVTFDIRDSDPKWIKLKEEFAAQPFEKPYISNYAYMTTVKAPAIVRIP